MLRIYWEFARPFTLLMPAIGVLAGGLVAWGADPRLESTWTVSRWVVLAHLAIGALMAAVLNAGSNGLNQIYDLEIDRINKPTRPLPSGRLGIRQAWRFTALALTAGLILAWMVNLECFLLALAALVLTACYSVPPARTKRWGIPANLTVSIPRGFLLPIAGWTTVKTATMSEPWLLCLPLGLFILGATSTKDFSDIPGDRAGGCQTLPVKYGIRRTALMIAPFFVFPFPLWAIFSWAGWLSGSAVGIGILSVALPLMGAAIAFRILRDPEALSSGENHVSWRLIYLMTIVAYAGLALAYLWPRLS